MPAKTVKKTRTGTAKKAPATPAHDPAAVREMAEYGVRLAAAAELEVLVEWLDDHDDPPPLGEVLRRLENVAALVRQARRPAG